MVIPSLIILWILKNKIKFMKNNFLNSPLTNINSKPSSNSEVLSQILYGEKFRILKRKKNWVKIKTYYDNYIGYIKKDKFYQNFKPERKISKLKSRIFLKKKWKIFSFKKIFIFCIRNIYFKKK